MTVFQNFKSSIGFCPASVVILEPQGKEQCFTHKFFWNKTTLIEKILRLLFNLVGMSGSTQKQL